MGGGDFEGSEVGGLTYYPERGVSGGESFTVS
jgi:hypothetical protein